MALRSTVYKADIHIADNDRGYYGSHAVTLARHPSETDERLMVRVLAFALHADADDRLAFTKGLSDADEPALWQLDLTGAIETWIDVGLPEERRLLKACGRSGQVIVYAYGRNAAQWWQGVEGPLARTKNLTVLGLSADASQALAALAQRGMALNVNVQDGAIWLSGESGEASIELERWRAVQP